MLVSRIGSRSTRTVLTQTRDSLLRLVRQKRLSSPALPNQYHSLVESRYKDIPGQISLLHHPFLGGSPYQQFGISSSATPQPNVEDNSQSGVRSIRDNEDSTKSNAETEASAAQDEKDVSDSEAELSRDDLVKLLAEKEDQLKVKDEELKTMHDKALRACADMQNSMDRTKREAENMKKFAIQDFAKNLLDVADNLGRASSSVKGKFSKIDESEDTVGAVPLLKTLLQGVEMTEKQLAEVFKKYGVQKYDPLDEEFDPHRHNAVFQVPDPSKSPGTIAAVLKPGYMLHDRILRPAEVGVTKAVENEAD